MNRKLQLLVTSGVATWALAGGAFAQDDANVIEEIVVTAEKREQSLQDVPVAVSAFTDESREVLGINNAQDLVNFTPGINYNTGNDRLTMRGIGRLTNNRSSEGGVAMYNDGFFTSSVYSFSKSTLFLERTEVLRGPQGTLYGRNSIGGAMNIISKRPTDEFYAEVRGTVANYDQTIVQAAVSGPLFGGIRGRLAGNWDNQREGYFTNLAGGPTEGGRGEIYYYEIQLDGELADGQFEWWTKYEKAKWEALGRGAGGRQGVTFGVPNIATRISGATPGSSWANLASVFPPQPLPGMICDLCFSTDTPNEIDIDSETFTLHATLHLEGFDVRYVGGKTWYHYELRTDVDGTANGTPFTLFPNSPGAPGTPTGGGQIIPTGGTTFFPKLENRYDEEPWWFSNELNFASTHEGPVQWLLGLYQFREEANYTPVDARVVDDVRFETPRMILGTPSIRNPTRTYAIGQAKTRSESYAAFGQVDWQINDQWKTTLGLRYTKDEKTAVEGARLICFMGVSPACPPVLSRLFGQPIDFTQVAVATGTQIDPSVTTPVYTDPVTGLRGRVLQNEWDGWSGTFGFDWQPDPDTLVYAKYTRGYKAGGFNSATTTIVPEVTTQKETVDAYEIGAKKTFMGNLQVNASAFLYNYQDIQAVLSQFDPFLNTNVARYVNLPEASIKGFEVESIWQPIDNLRLTMNYSYLEGTVEEGCCFEDPDDPLALAPGANRAQQVGSNWAQDLEGQSLSGITPHRVTVNAAYTWELSPGDLTASVSYFWRDETFHSVFNRYYNIGKAYEQVDARLLFNDADDRFTIIAFAKNIFDTRGQVVVGGTRLTNVGPNQGLINQNISFIEPRRYGLEFQYRFR